MPSTLSLSGWASRRGMVSGWLKQSIVCSSPPQIDAFSLFAWRLADNRATDLTKEGMLKGIEHSAAFVLFLSQGVLERPYCQLEIRHAMALKKPMVLLVGAKHMYVWYFR